MTKETPSLFGRLRPKRPAWDSGWNRPLALVELLAQPVLLVIAILLYGLLEGPRGQWRNARFLTKTIWHGRTGPYRGISW